MVAKMQDFVRLKNPLGGVIGAPAIPSAVAAARL